MRKWEVALVEDMALASLNYNIKITRWGAWVAQ